MVITNLFPSMHRSAPLLTDKIKTKDRLHWVLEVQNGKALLGHSVQLAARAEGFVSGLFTQIF